MDAVLQIVGSLILLLLLYSLLEMLLPEGGLAPFVRLVMGLTLLAAAVTPLSRSGTAGLPELLPALAPAMEATDYAAQGTAIRERLTAGVRQEQEEAAASRIAALAAAAEGVERAGARVYLDGDGGLTRVELYLKARDEAACQQAKELVCAFCLLGPEQVECRKWEEYHE